MDNNDEMYKEPKAVDVDEDDDEFHFGKWFLRFLVRLAITAAICRFLLFWFFEWLGYMLPLGTFITFPIAYIFIYMLLFHRGLLFELIVGSSGSGNYKDLSGYHHKTREEADAADSRMQDREMLHRIFNPSDNDDENDPRYWEQFR